MDGHHQLRRCGPQKSRHQNVTALLIRELKADCCIARPRAGLWTTTLFAPLLFRATLRCMDATNKFFLYARKSTDDPKRQLRSIKDQIAETRDLASREGIEVVDTFVEKQTAKKPGRPVFNEMLERIERGEASGILAWHPDRLARNSLDGGRLIWLVDTGKIMGLKFPSFRFDATPQGKLSLAIEFGISKYYVDKLSEDISRGIRQKLKNGLWPQFAPLGYLNDRKEKTIFPDPEKAPLIRKAFEMYGTGNYTLRQVRTAINDLGLSGHKGGTLWVANYQYILKNPIYYGLIRYHGEYYDGKHEPIISKELFDQVQDVMSGKSKPKSDKLKPYIYRGLFRCGECGRLVTTETQKGHNYLRCSKWEVTCSQRYVREESIAEQVTDALRLVALPPEWADWMVAQADAEEATEVETVSSHVQAIKSEITAREGHLDRLMTAYVETVLSLPEYKIAKNKLMDEKQVLTEKLTTIQTNQSSAF
jgi:DNA invertase Pin-like site-specific DNA recombinase